MCCQRAAADSRCRLHQSIFIFTCAASRCSESAIIVHQSIIIFTCAASRCLESAVIVYRSHLRRSGTVNLRFKMIIFKSCPIGPDRLHTACSCALCRARCFELRLSFVTVEQICPTDRVGQLRSTALVTIACSCSAAGIAAMCETAVARSEGEQTSAPPSLSQSRWLRSRNGVEVPAWSG